MSAVFVTLQVFQRHFNATVLAAAQRGTPPWWAVKNYGWTVGARRSGECGSHSGSVRPVLFLGSACENSVGPVWKCSGAPSCWTTVELRLVAQSWFTILLNDSGAPSCCKTVVPHLVEQSWCAILLSHSAAPSCCTVMVHHLVERQWCSIFFNSHVVQSSWKTVVRHLVARHWCSILLNSHGAPYC